MSKLQQLIDRANEGKNLQEIVYGGFPVEIHRYCGEEEVREILVRLDQLSIEREKIEDWDGDSQDDISRVQSGFSELLEKLIDNYAGIIIDGLKSDRPDTCFYVAHAFLKAPNSKAIQPLAEYLLRDLSDFYRDIGREALEACKKREGHLVGCGGNPPEK